MCIQCACDISSFLHGVGLFSIWPLCSASCVCVWGCSLCKVYVIKVFIWLWGFRRAVQRSLRLDLPCVRGEWEITSAVRRGKVKNNLSSLLSLSYSLLPGCPPSHLCSFLSLPSSLSLSHSYSSAHSCSSWFLCSLVLPAHQRSTSMCFEDF